MTSRADEEQVFTGPASWLWTKPSEDGRIVVGLTEEAADVCGLILFAELPEAGDHILQGCPFMLLETATREIELPAPLSGLILEVNRAVERNPGLLHQSPDEQAWLVVLEPGED